MSSVLRFLRNYTSYTSWRTKAADLQPREPTLLDHQTPSDAYLLQCIIALSLAVLTATFVYKQHVDPKGLMQSFGVSMKKVARAVREIERKAFHVAGLLVPLIQLTLLRNGFTTADCSHICWTITAVGWCCDAARLYVPFVARNWPLRSILREHEHRQLTGGCYFSLGCTLSIGECFAVC